MAFLEGIWGFPTKGRGDVGPAVVGRLLRFASKAGKIAASLVSVDESGNLSTPGVLLAGESARMQTSGGAATFGHADAAVDFPAVRQYSNGETSVSSDQTLALVGDADNTDKAFIYVSSDVTQIYRGPNSGVSLETSAVLQVDGEGSKVGGFLPPRLDSTGRGAISSPATGLIIFNTTSGRLELYDGSAWVGLTTTP